MTDTHDFHYSRMELKWSESSHTWQVVTRVFTDDLEQALQSAHAIETSLNLGDDQEHIAGEDWISGYLHEHCIGSLIATENSAIQWNYIGKEVEFDLTYLYFESQPLGPHDQLNLTVSLFFELFEDQVNEVTFQVGDATLREWLTFEAPKTMFQWQP